MSAQGRVEHHNGYPYYESDTKKLFFHMKFKNHPRWVIGDNLNDNELYAICTHFDIETPEKCTVWDVGSNASGGTTDSDPWLQDVNVFSNCDTPCRIVWFRDLRIEYPPVMVFGDHAALINGRTMYRDSNIQLSWGDVNIAGSVFDTWRFASISSGLLLDYCKSGIGIVPQDCTEWHSSTGGNFANIGLVTYCDSCQIVVKGASGNPDMNDVYSPAGYHNGRIHFETVSKWKIQWDEAFRVWEIRDPQDLRSATCSFNILTPSICDQVYVLTGQTLVLDSNAYMQDLDECDLMEGIYVPPRVEIRRNAGVYAGWELSSNAPSAFGIINDCSTCTGWMSIPQSSAVGVTGKQKFSFNGGKISIGSQQWIRISHERSGGCPSVNALKKCSGNQVSVAVSRCCSVDGSSCTSSKPGSSLACSGELSYEAAVIFCAAISMRLCTSAEIASSICCNANPTGCGYDSELTWTSDECGGCLNDADCDDSEECTQDSCDTTGVCINSNTDGVFCNDGDASTIDDTCSQGKCARGKDIPATCRIHKKQAWCTHPTRCGKTCRETCTALGLTISDFTDWYEGQNTEAKCSELKSFFGMNRIYFDPRGYLCLLEFRAPYIRYFTANGAPILNTDTKLVCSGDPACPDRSIDHSDNRECDNSGSLTICACGALVQSNLVLLREADEGYANDLGYVENAQPVDADNTFDQEVSESGNSTETEIVEPGSSIVELGTQMIAQEQYSQQQQQQIIEQNAPYDELVDTSQDFVAQSFCSIEIEGGGKDSGIDGTYSVGVEVDARPSYVNQELSVTLLHGNGQWYIKKNVDDTKLIFKLSNAKRAELIGNKEWKLRDSANLYNDRQIFIQCKFDDSCGSMEISFRQETVWSFSSWSSSKSSQIGFTTATDMTDYTSRRLHVYVLPAEDCSFTIYKDKSPVDHSKLNPFQHPAYSTAAKCQDYCEASGYTVFLWLDTSFGNPWNGVCFIFSNKDAKDNHYDDISTMIVTTGAVTGLSNDCGPKNDNDECFYDRYPGQNAIHGVEIDPQKWPRSSTETGCEFFCEELGCRVYTWFDENTDTSWAGRCVMWTFDELTAHERLDTGAWHADVHAFSGLLRSCENLVERYVLPENNIALCGEKCRESNPFKNLQKLYVGAYGDNCFCSMEEPLEGRFMPNICSLECPGHTQHKCGNLDEFAITIFSANTISNLGFLSPSYRYPGVADKDQSRMLKAGAPRYFVAQQMQGGAIEFQFVDACTCEERFEYIRAASVHHDKYRNLLDFELKLVTRQECGFKYSVNVAETVGSFENDLTRKLQIGRDYTFCLRINTDLGSARDYVTYSKVCTNVKPFWEAALSGVVKTKNGAGVRNVAVTAVMPNGETFNDTTTISGGYSIWLHGNYDIQEVVVTVTPKLSESGIEHVFECGSIGECKVVHHAMKHDPDISEIQKQTQLLDFIDVTLVDITGTVYVYEPLQPDLLCPEEGVIVCLHYVTPPKTFSPSVDCYETIHDGKYFLQVPMLVGATIQVFAKKRDARYEHKFADAAKPQNQRVEFVNTNFVAPFVNIDIWDVTARQVQIFVGGGECMQDILNWKVLAKPKACTQISIDITKTADIKFFGAQEYIFTLNMDPLTGSTLIKAMKFGLDEIANYFEFFQPIANMTDVDPGHISEIKFLYHLPITIKVDDFNDVADDLQCTNKLGYWTLQSDKSYKLKVRLEEIFSSDETLKCAGILGDLKVFGLPQRAGDPKNPLPEEDVPEGCGDPDTGFSCVLKAVVTGDPLKGETPESTVVFNIKPLGPSLTPKFLAMEFCFQVDKDTVLVSPRFVQQIVILGNERKLPATQVALPQHIPLLILRSPPGDKSITEVVRHSGMTMSFAVGSGHAGTLVVEASVVFGVAAKLDAGWWPVYLGTSLEGGVGFKFQSDSDWTTLYTGSKTLSLSVTQGFQTPDGGLFQGLYESAMESFIETDVYVCPAFNIEVSDIVLYRLVKTDGTCALDVSTDHSWTLPDSLGGFDPATNHFHVEADIFAFYTEFHIKNDKIPYLEGVINTANCQAADDACHTKVKVMEHAVASWKEIIALNAHLKQEAEDLLTLDRMTMVLNTEADVGEFIEAYTPNKLRKNQNIPYMTTLPEGENNDKFFKRAKEESGRAFPASFRFKERSDESVPKEVDMVTFNGGGSVYSFTYESTQDSGYEYELSSTKDNFIGIESKLIIKAGALASNEILGGGSFAFSAESVRGYVATTSLTQSVTLSDSTIGDEFTVRIQQDKFGWLVFDTLGGKSSCPREIGTVHREKFSLSLDLLTGDKQEVTGLPPDKEVRWNLISSNETPDGLTFFVVLEVHDNFQGLILAANGSPFEQHSYTMELAPNTFYTTFVTGKRPEGTTDDFVINLTLGSACEPTYTMPMTVKVKFDKLCATPRFASSDPWVAIPPGPGQPATIDIIAVNDKWKTNNWDSTAPGDLTIMFRYRLKSPFGVMTWINDPGAFNFADPNIQISGRATHNFAPLPNFEGSMELQLFSQCTDVPAANLYFATDRVYSEIWPGTVDRVKPQIVNYPEPQDEQYNAGDEISFQFDEPILCVHNVIGFLSKSYVKEYDPVTKTMGAPVTHTIYCPNEGRDGKVMFSFKELLKDYVDKTIAIELESTYDLHGNVQVNTTPRFWPFIVADIKLVVYVVVAPGSALLSLSDSDPSSDILTAVNFSNLAPLEEDGLPRQFIEDGNIVKLGNVPYARVSYSLPDFEMGAVNCEIHYTAIVESDSERIISLYDSKNHLIDEVDLSNFENEGKYITLSSPIKCTGDNIVKFLIHSPDDSLLVSPWLKAEVYLEEKDPEPEHFVSELCEFLNISSDSIEWESHISRRRIHAKINHPNIELLGVAHKDDDGILAHQFSISGYDWLHLREELQKDQKYLKQQYSKNFPILFSDRHKIHYKLQEQKQDVCGLKSTHPHIVMSLSGFKNATIFKLVINAGIEYSQYSLSFPDASDQSARYEFCPHNIPQKTHFWTQGVADRCTRQFVLIVPWSHQFEFDVLGLIETENGVLQGFLKAAVNRQEPRNNEPEEEIFDLKFEFHHDTSVEVQPAQNCTEHYDFNITDTYVTIGAVYLQMELYSSVDLMSGTICGGNSTNTHIYQTHVIKLSGSCEADGNCVSLWELEIKPVSSCEIDDLFDIAFRDPSWHPQHIFQAIHVQASLCPEFNVAPCDALPENELLTAVGDCVGTKSEDSCTFECPAGYTPAKQTVQCRNGKWGHAECKLQYFTTEADTFLNVWHTCSISGGHLAIADTATQRDEIAKVCRNSDEHATECFIGLLTNGAWIDGSPVDFDGMDVYDDAGVYDPHEPQFGVINVSEQEHSFCAFVRGAAKELPGICQIGPCIVNPVPQFVGHEGLTSDMTVECSDIPTETPELHATDGCSEWTVEPTKTVIPSNRNPNEKETYLTWTIQHDEQDIAELGLKRVYVEVISQVIVHVDKPPHFVFDREIFTSVITVECGELVDDIPEISAVDTCDGPVDVVIEELDISGTTIRVWKAVDSQGQSAVMRQTIIYAPCSRTEL